MTLTIRTADGQPHATATLSRDRRAALGALQLAARLVALLAVAGFAVAWFVLFRPTPFGGTASYVIVSGHSMEPALHPGDLAIVRAQSSYAPGDLVAFRADGSDIIHRIVGGDAANGFVTQGDNNPTPDFWRPTGDEIIGKRWLSVPEGGRWLLFFRTPVNFAILAAAATAALLFGTGSRARTQRPERDVPDARDTSAEDAVGG